MRMRETVCARSMCPNGGSQVSLLQPLVQGDFRDPTDFQEHVSNYVIWFTVEGAASDNYSNEGCFGDFYVLKITTKHDLQSWK